jgi:hypothetical protein
VTERHEDAVIVVQPALDPVEVAALKQVSAFTSDIAIKTIQVQSVGIIASMESVAPFAVGDFVAVSTTPSAIATVESIDAAKKALVLSAGFTVQPGQDLVVANWRCATTVASVGGFVPNQVIVGRGDAVVPGSFVVRREDDDSFSKAVAVTQVNGAAVALAESIPGLKRLDTLAVGVFPRIATVLAQQAQETSIGIVEPGALAVGDHVVLVGGAEPAVVAQVVSVAGNIVTLNESLGVLNAGQRLAVVHFRDRVGLSAVGIADPTQIAIDREIELRENDLVGVLTHYADNSNPGVIDSVLGNRLTLTVPGIASGDGIVSQDWIDGGILGAAAVTFQLAPFQFQPLLRLANVDGLEQPRPSVASGFDLIGGRFVSRLVVPLLLNPAAGHVLVYPLEPNGYRYRPETLSLITTFNADFPRAFATFAQKQKLSVRWIGCLREFPRASGCPGEQPYEVCDVRNSSGD